MFGRKSRLTPAEAAEQAASNALGLFEEARAGLVNAYDLHEQVIGEAHNEAAQARDDARAAQERANRVQAEQDAIASAAVEAKSRVARSINKIDEILGS